MLRLPAARVENTFVRGVDFGTPGGVGLRCAVYRYYGVFLFVRFVHILMVSFWLMILVLRLII